MAEVAGGLPGVSRKIEKVELPPNFSAQAVPFQVMLQGDLQILRDAERLEYAGDLELHADAAADPVVRLEPGDVAPIVKDLAAGRRIFAKDEAEERAFSCAVRANQTVQFARFEGEIHVDGHLQAAEALVELTGLEQRHHAVSRARRRSRRCGSDARAMTRPCGASSTVTTSRAPMATSAYWLP